MKYWTIGFVGFVLGASAALGLLYVNPLTAARSASLDAGARALRYELPAQALSFVHGESALLPGTAGSDEQFWEETISGAAMLALSLNGESAAPAAIASRLLLGSTETDLLLNGVLLEDHWLLTVPGEGSLFVRVDSNLWPFLKQTFIPAWYLGRSFPGPSEYQPTVGPGHRTALVVGGTGRFAALEGSALETYRVTALDRDKQSLGISAEMQLSVLENTVVADSEP